MHTTKLFWMLNVAEFSIKPEDGPPKCIGFKDTENGNEADKSIQYSCPAERKKERKKEGKREGRKISKSKKEGTINCCRPASFTEKKRRRRRRRKRRRRFFSKRLSPMKGEAGPSGVYISMWHRLDVHQLLVDVGAVKTWHFACYCCAPHSTVVGISSLFIYHYPYFPIFEIICVMASIGLPQYPVR